MGQDLLVFLVVALELLFRVLSKETELTYQVVVGQHLLPEVLNRLRLRRQGLQVFLLVVLGELLLVNELGRLGRSFPLDDFVLLSA